MKQELEQVVAAVSKKLFDVNVAVELTRPDEQFGDYATNIALQLAGRLGRNPREVASEIVNNLHNDAIASVDVAGPGFINIRLNNLALYSAAKAAAAIKPTDYRGKQVVAEYSDPNPFKVLHAGHLYTSVVGDGIANLLAAAGGEVHRVNFGGDVGLHVGKTMWAIIDEFGGEYPEKLQTIDAEDHAEWMAKAYVRGANAYEEDEAAKQQIVALNKRVYQLHTDNDHESPFAQIYWTCRRWSYEYFDAFYDRIGTKFEKYYPESTVADLGLRTVREQLANGVYEQSDGAVVFRGEPYGLHTRVFINREGIPTYEAKDVGLIMSKWRDYHFDKSVVITGNEQEQYMAVVLKSIEQYRPELVRATAHLTHGLVKLQGGIKMSSRKGNFLRAVDVLDVAEKANRQATGKDDPNTVLGAVKYAFLKQRIGADIIYDPEESVSLQGNSGPYLMYAHARARSILGKIDSNQPAVDDPELQDAERTLARKISEYPEVLALAVNELMPHHICTYLYELAQTFNRFYEHNRVVGDPRETLRVGLVTAYTDTLRDGLGLLGIAAPDRM